MPAASASGCRAAWAAYPPCRQAGWSFTTIYLHLEANAGGGKELQHNASIVSGLHARADAPAFVPAYTFETPVLGGQLTVGAIGVPGLTLGC